MYWEWKSVWEGIRDEYRGWRKFRRATGIWPIYSVLAGIFSIPAWFVSGLFLLIRAAETYRLILIYSSLFAGAICGAALWYGLRILACKADIARAQRKTGGRTSTQSLKYYLM